MLGITNMLGPNLFPIAALKGQNQVKLWYDLGTQHVPTNEKSRAYLRQLIIFGDGSGIDDRSRNINVDLAILGQIILHHVNTNLL